jgi:hypothetical protein
MNVPAETQHSTKPNHKPITLELPHKQFLRLKRGSKARFMCNLQRYEIRVKEVPTVFNSAGKQLTKAQLKALLRKM